MVPYKGGIPVAKQGLLGKKKHTPPELLVVKEGQLAIILIHDTREQPILVKPHHLMGLCRMIYIC